MKNIRTCQCPECKNMDTYSWYRRIKIGFEELQKEFPNQDFNDYLLSKHKCQNCGEIFYTKTKVNIIYNSDEDQMLSVDEARYEGLI